MPSCASHKAGQRRICGVCTYRPGAAQLGTFMDKLIRLTVSAWAVCVVLVAGASVTTQHPPVQPQDKPVRAVEAAASKEPPPDENALIEAALVAQGYFREDVPLSFELQDALHTACEASNVPYHVALGLIWVESRFQPDADNGTSYGLCQLNRDYFPDKLTPAENIWAGMEYLGSLIDQYGDLGAALCAYHDGHDTGRRGYSNAVLEAAEVWKTAIENPPAEADG